MRTDGNADYRALFTEMVRKPDEDIELDRAALYLAGEEYPAINVPSLLAELDAFASQIAFRIDPGVATADLAGSIAEYLFNDVGFHGNTGEYYSPDNSFLNRVLETRTGIPITLSLLFMDSLVHGGGTPIGSQMLRSGPTGAFHRRHRRHGGILGPIPCRSFPFSNGLQ